MYFCKRTANIVKAPKLVPEKYTYARNTDFIKNQPLSVKKIHKFASSTNHRITTIKKEEIKNE